MTTLVLNPTNQELTFTLPPFWSDNTTPLDPKSVTAVEIDVGNVPGGPYTKTIQDTALTLGADGKYHYPLASLGVDLTQPTYTVTFTVTGAVRSSASNEVGFQNIVPNPPALSVD